MLCHSTYSLSHPTSGHCILQSIHNHNFSTHVAIQLATRQVSLASQAGRQCVAERDSRQRRTRGEESGAWGVGRAGDIHAAQGLSEVLSNC